MRVLSHSSDNSSSGQCSNSVPEVSSEPPATGGSSDTATRVHLIIYIYLLNEYINFFSDTVGSKIYYTLDTRHKTQDKKVHTERAGFFEGL